ncbi:MAG: transcription termination factor NusA [Ruminococcus sp.]|jgi:N utilization substance protein A|nr:transcription termination factor NusA [Ruminococcus sp.]
MKKKQSGVQPVDPKIELFAALGALADSYGIDLNSLCEKMEQGLLAAVRKEYPDCDDFTASISPSENKFEVCVLRTVVDDEPIDINEINIEEAVTIVPDCQLGDRVPFPLPVEKLGRVAAMQTKQSLKRDIREFERDKILNEFSDKEQTLVTGFVNTIDPANMGAMITIDKTDVFLSRNDQIPGERLKEGSPILVYVAGISNPDKKPQVKITRSSKEFVQKLFEREIPEIADGTVEIKAVSREAGAMSKVAVYSENPDVDAVGACIGRESTRINSILRELRNERVDIINWNEDPAVFAANALSPAQVISVEVTENENERVCTVTVPNNQLSLAIGKKGQNAKVAARLTGYKIDIKPEVPTE